VAHEIEFAEGLPLPLEIITQKTALMAQSGSGKSYAAGKIVEGVADAGGQFFVVDPVGTWWGLRLAKDGKSAGIEVPVLGGEHGDVPLEPTSGALIAKLIAEQRTSLVLDVSDMNGSEQRRFVTDFALALHKAKKSRRSAVLGVWEECQDFVPQRVAGDSARMVGAMEKLIKQGRNFGIGTMLISQRPQAVNKDVLNQTEVLIALRTIGPHERKAIEGWVVANAYMQSATLAELPSLPNGTAFVWSPSWLRIFKKVKVGTKRTFDASKTPEFGARSKHEPAPQPIDLAELSSAMAATIERAKADDPRELRNTIDALKRDLAAAKSVKPTVERVEVPVIGADTLAEISRLEASARERQSEASAAAVMFKAAADVLRSALSARGSVAAPSSRASAPRMVVDSRPRLVRTPVEGEPKLGRCERALLSVLAQRDTSNTAQLAILSGYSSTSSGFANALGALRSSGLAEGRGDAVRITNEGRDALGPVDPLPQGPALVAYWQGKLGLCERTLLGVLVDAGPNAALSKEQLAELSGYSATSSGFANALGKLRTLELVEGRGEIRASETLFMAGAA
jgi:hypothetical protein